MVKETRLVDRRWEEVVWDEELLEQAVNGRIAIYILGHRAPYRLSASQWKEFAAAKKRGYVVAKKTNADRALLNVWFSWCELHRWPYIKVCPRKDYASVQMDLIAAPYKLDEDQVDRLRPSIESARHESRWWLSHTGGCMSYVEKATIDNAHALAEAMLSVGLEAKREHEMKTE